MGQVMLWLLVFCAATHQGLSGLGQLPLKGLHNCILSDEVLA